MSNKLQIAKLLSFKNHRRKPVAFTSLVHLNTATINSLSLDTMVPVNFTDVSG